MPKPTPPTNKQHETDIGCFTPFQAAVNDIQLPEKFTYPFCYQPHPLSQIATEELQAHLSIQTNWQHNFGLECNTEDAAGKMFGILVVKNSKGQLGYLSAFSGKLADQNQLPHFVPPVFDMITKDSFFLTEQANINDLNNHIKALEANPKLAELTAQLADIESRANLLLAEQREHVISRRKSRKAKRSQAETALNKQTITQAAFDLQQLELSKESVFDKNELKALKAELELQIITAQAKLQHLTDEITALKNERKKRSNALQQQLFEQYRFLNTNGEYKNLEQLFQNMPHPPPAGAGDCAAPKLLHYAFSHNLTPIAMAEFWWGVAPKSEIRQHKNFYPACQGKCFPILSHMLEGLTVDDNPLLNNTGASASLDIIYQDEDMVIVNKPAELLSVPGKNIQDSVYQRVKDLFPHATGNYIIHRLDMSTSGLMVLALNIRAQKALQHQFIKRTVNKRYVALVDGQLVENKGEINLPLSGDYYDRPRQLVDFDEGKPAETTWQVIEQNKQHTKVYLYPKTGRTHQLRVHCAHHLGLNMPIVGDDLYGVKANRLHLHADLLELNHPITKERMSFQVDPEF